jgi:hypothetical protein
VPRSAADNRTFSSSGGSYKTSDRFIIRPSTGETSWGERSIGSTFGIPGLGLVGHSSSVAGDDWSINAGGMPIYLRRWAVMLLLIVPLTLVTVTAVLTWFVPTADPYEGLSLTSLAMSPASTLAMPFSPQRS